MHDGFTGESGTAVRTCLLTSAQSCDSAFFLFGVPLKKLLWFTVDFPL